MTRIPGGRAFRVLWAGQMVSLVGSGLTSFALGVWVYQRTGSATQFGLIALSTALPGIVLSPVGGALVDRCDRRRMLVACDVGAGLCSLALALLYFAGRLQVWHVWGILGLAAVFSVPRSPALAASTTLLVPKDDLARAAGMMQAAQAASMIAAPLAAGFLLGTIGVAGVLVIDAVSFVLSLASVLAIAIPAAPSSAERPRAATSLWSDAAVGWSYVASRPGLAALLGFFAVANFVLGFVEVLLVPMALGFLPAPALGSMLAAGGLGMLAGGLLATVWGGPRRRIRGVLSFTAVLGLGLWGLGLRPSAPLVTAALVALLFVVPLINAANQALWQVKVPADVQGRVFAIRRMTALSCQPLAYITAGPLADRVCGPLLAPGGALAGSVGRVLGSGPGRGAALVFIVMGTGALVIALAGALYPRLRRVERELPDMTPDDVMRALRPAPAENAAPAVAEVVRAC